jgi:[acyl-carrier-protein] S-malonyltransferase
MAQLAFIFPGQGAQVVGMGKDLAARFPEAAAVFDEADAVLDMPLARLCFEGPNAELTRTDVAQPAILAMSIATLRAAEAAGAVGAAAMAGGLSLGEYTALCAAGSISLADALRLVRLRGQAMQDAAAAGDGGMVAVVGAEEAGAEQLCRDAAFGDVLVCANFNCPGQVVLSGAKAACGRAVELGGQRGYRCVPLTVAGAFHSPLMAPAAERLAAALEGVELKAPRIPVAANATGGFHLGDPAAIRAALVRQLTGTVRWGGCQEAMLAAGAEAFVEIGPGRTLSGMLRKVRRDVPCTALGAAEAVEQAAGSGGVGRK